MREILFRAKAINRDKGEHRTSYKNGDWVYGLITRPYKDMFPTLPMEMRNTNGIDGIEVDYKTVGQFTGLTDKNGKKIFEGDIIKTKEFGKDSGNGVNFNSFDIFEVIYSSASFKLNNSLRLFNMVKGQEFEVIGNIHDNPELLEG